MSVGTAYGVGEQYLIYRHFAIENFHKKTTSRKNYWRFVEHRSISFRVEYNFKIKQEQLRGLTVPHIFLFHRPIIYEIVKRLV